MREDLYRIAGNVTIPEEKKEEFNRHILQVLYRGGIRKTGQADLGGRKVTVVDYPVPDEQGIVSFDYSIFEKRKRKTATYNTVTCELVTPDRGYQEFGAVMNLIMVMQEAYSEGKCYFMREDKPCHVDAYVAVIRDMLGIDLDFSHREKMWDMLLFLKSIEEYQNITAQTIWDAFSFDLCRFFPEQFIAVFEIDSEEIRVPPDPFQGEKDAIREAPRGKLKYYVYQKIQCLVAEGQEEGLKLFLKELLDADLPGRKALTEHGLFGTIAEVSLYVLPSVIVHVYAAAVNRPFWDAWKDLGIKGYSDIMADQRIGSNTADGGNKFMLPFYKAMQRKNEDEFMEFWGGEPLCFSEDMEECLADWRERFQGIHPEDDFDMEDFLAQIVIDLDRDWGCRLVDRAFITECIGHKNDINYKKALLLYREFMDEDTAYFPELTKKQAIQWIIRGNRYQFDYTAMGAFQSLLTNHKHRSEVFGF